MAEAIGRPVTYSDRVALDDGAFAHLVVAADSSVSLLVSDYRGVVTEIGARRESLVALRGAITWALQEQSALMMERG